MKTVHSYPPINELFRKGRFLTIKSPSRGRSATQLMTPPSPPHRKTCRDVRDLHRESTHHVRSKTHRTEFYSTAKSTLYAAAISWPCPLRVRVWLWRHFLSISRLSSSAAPYGRRC